MVVIAYSAWLGLLVVRGHGPQRFVHIGGKFSSQGHSSPYIHPPADARLDDAGYDGQFVYYIAVDPIHARDYMDFPAYRYMRILYPTLARIAALGRPALVPWAMLLINLAAAGAGTFAVAALLLEHRMSAWLALLYGFFPGMVNAMQSDLTEPLGYGLAAAAVLLLVRRRPAAAAILFALAGLARETTLVFPLVYGGWLLFAPRPGIPRRGAVGLLGAVLPLLAWKVWLRVWLGSWGMGATVEHLPYQGILDFWPWSLQQWVEVVAVAAPGAVCMLAAAWMLLRGPRRPEAAILLLSGLLLTVFLGNPSYFSYVDSGRASIGMVVAALLAAGGQRVLGARPWWLAPGALLWFSVAPIGLALPHSAHAFKL